ncbi:Uncharacterized membrane protein SpoIIM, required for sporulation [Chitinophaga costaii]|uniref:Uncharacterized membrane protein SpoIIM, required for sporulation n=1 Tax=Chitinophaga costaii TaxID=1335309 RepID=A0A1C4G1Y7_9BACT|nr:stage II sporulation protein M [Chitinophaga costaii]PUZ19942.1 stage II sporulation protein M [Chitinophaga costaii]SCC61885.1 Uncharacterized membrane protein SpoIIM, required for sporulation [Chitinophaga costaii]
MRESLFIKRNLERWQKIQQEPAKDPDEMAAEFTTLLDDLAYAKTFYSYSKVTRYINGMAAGIYQRIYKNRKEDQGRIRSFFALELPLLFRRNQGIFLFTTLFFIFFCVIAAFSAAHDDTFVRGVLSDSYINMTEQNIAKGDPFGVYNDGNELLMFLEIAKNNISIALSCFVTGIALCLGPAYLLVVNGMMLGAFQYYFFSKGLGAASVLVIWIHGTLEISAIILSGTAGFVMGSKILFPGTRKRVDALKQGAKDGLKIMVMVIPMLLCAGFLEGFVTRHTHMPLAASISILALSLSFVVGYFVFYPIYLHRRGYVLEPDGAIIRPAKKNV